MSWWVGLGYNFDCDWLIHATTIECDWLIELSDSKLTDNNLASELVENRSVFQPITIQGIVIFMMMIIITIVIVVLN